MFNHEIFQSRMSAVMHALADAAVVEMKILLHECSPKAERRCEAPTTSHSPVKNEEGHYITLEGAQQRFNKTMTNQFALIMATLTQEAVGKMTVLLQKSMAEIKSIGSAKQWTREKDTITPKRLRPGPRQTDNTERSDEPHEMANTEMNTPLESQDSQMTPTHSVSEHIKEDNIPDTNSESISDMSATNTSKIKKTAGSSPIKCPACEKTFALKCFFDRHFLSHSKPHPCSQCDKRFARPEGLAAHARRHTGEKPFSCVECGTRFAYKSAFNRHMRQQHMVKKTCAVHSHTCTYCERQFHGTQAFQRHRCSALGRTFSCSICPETFQCRLRLAEHEKGHSGDRDFVCETCGERFISSASLSAHRVTHADAAACCNALGLGCSDARVLQNHLSKHTGQKLFECDVCGKGCSHASALKHHMLTHTGEKPFVCDACGKRCSHASALQNHMRTHTGQKPGKQPVCPLCGKCLSSMVKLKYHMSVHTGEKPYSCKQCSRRFSNPSNLRVHAATHTGDKLYGCAVCGRRFTQATSLKVHRLVHTGERPHRCHLCAKAFTYRADLNKHLLGHTQSQTEKVKV